MVPVSSPTVEGVPCIVLVQVAAGASTNPELQVPGPVSDQSAANVPPKVVTGVARVMLVVPVLVTVNVWAAVFVPCVTLPKLKDVGEMLMDVTATPIPVPVSESVPEAFPLIFRVAVRAPTAVGVNVTVSVQVPEVATIPPLVQVPPVRTNSEAFVPVMVKNGVFRTKLAEPVFVTVMVCAPLMVLIV